MRLDATQAFRHMLEPESVALVGASANPASPGGAMFERLRHLSVPTWPVNPRLDHIDGVPCFASVRDLPGTPDLVVVATRSDLVPRALEDSAAAGARVVVSIAGGFSEIGGHGTRLEDEIRRIVERSGVRFLGPNTLGVVAPRSGIDTIFVRHVQEVFGTEGVVTLVTQSGSVGVEALGSMAGRGTGIRCFLGLGNQVDLDAVDAIEFCTDDQGTAVTALYLESIGDGRRLLAAARRHVRAGKPLVILKVGRTDRASRAAASHTGRLAGDDAIFGGAMRQAGAIRAADDEQLMDLTLALSLSRPAPGDRVAVVSAAGGYAVIGTDMVLERSPIHDLRMAKLTPATRSLIEAACPPYGSSANPLDMTGMADDDMYAAVLDALAEAPEVDSMVCFLSWGPHGLTGRTLDHLARVARGPKPVVVHALGGPDTAGMVADLCRRGVPAYPSMRRAVDALRALSRWGAIRDGAYGA